MAVLFDCFDFYGLCTPYSFYSFYSKNDIDGKEPKVKMKDYSKPVKGRHPDALEKSHRREWIDSKYSKM